MFAHETMACIFYFKEQSYHAAVIGHQSAMLPLHETSVDAQQQTYQLTPIKSKQETGERERLID